MSSFSRVVGRPAEPTCEVVRWIPVDRYSGIRRPIHAKAIDLSPAFTRVPEPTLPARRYPSAPSLVERIHDRAAGEAVLRSEVARCGEARPGAEPAFEDHRPERVAEPAGGRGAVGPGSQGQRRRGRSLWHKWPYKNPEYGSYRDPSHDLDCAPRGDPPPAKRSSHETSPQLRPFRSRDHRRNGRPRRRRAERLMRAREVAAALLALSAIWGASSSSSGSQPLPTRAVPPHGGAGRPRGRGPLGLCRGTRYACRPETLGRQAPPPRPPSRGGPVLAHRGGRGPPPCLDGRGAPRGPTALRDAPRRRLPRGAALRGAGEPASCSASRASAGRSSAPRAPLAFGRGPSSARGRSSSRRSSTRAGASTPGTDGRRARPDPRARAAAGAAAWLVVPAFVTAPAASWRTGPSRLSSPWRSSRRRWPTSSSSGSSAGSGAKASTVTYAIPVFGVLWGAVFLGEP